METRNPTIDPPLFARPAHVYRSASPSPSPATSRPASPSRHSRNFSQSYDPLARDLSPTRTLKAFTSAPGTAVGKNETALARLIEKASNSEREFGVRIAQTCKDIRTWHDELQQWPWNDSFEEPVHTGAQDQEEGPYWGSLPQKTVVAYEQRTQDIRDGLYDQDVDALKDYVLAQHSHPKPDEDYERLDDFTALITATILHALPYLSRLDYLLNTWAIRLAVLRKIPGYLKGLNQAKSDLEKVWSDMGQQLKKSPGPDSLRQAFHSFQDQIEMRMGKVGGRLDSMLDDLEGREETLPDAWIDGFESLETGFSEWLTQTERHIHQQSLRSPRLPDKPAHSEVSTRELNSTITDFSDRDYTNSAHAAPHILLSADTQTEANTQPPADQIDPLHSFGIPLQPAESPILGSSPVPFSNGGDSDDFGSDSVTPDSRNVSLFGADVPVTSNDSGLQRAGSLKSLSPTLSRTRHVPIVVSYEEDKPASPSPSETPIVPEDHISSTAARPSSPAAESVPPITNSKVRARAAFLNGGLEQTQSLQKSVNSPVRPFEHASMAFTKLFSKANSTANSTVASRSSSTSSKASARKGLGLGIKNHEGFRTFHRSSPSQSSNKSDKAFGNNFKTASPQPVSSSPPLAPRHSSSPVRGIHAQSVPPSIKARDSDQSAEQVGPGKAMYVTPELEQDFFPSTEESKSTIDTIWTSPAMSDFPDNWPLPVQILEDEISSPNNPMDSDVFEQMFVDSLPGTPNGKSRRASRDENPLEKMFSKPSGFKEPMLDDTMLSGQTRRRSKSSSAVGGQRPHHRSRPSISSLSTSIAPISEMPTPASFDATPEIQDASTAGYFRAKQVRTPSDSGPSPLAGSISHQGSPNFEVYEAQPSPMSFNLNAPPPGNEDAVDTSQYEGDEQVAQARAPMIKRASVTSIENHARSELNTIDIPDIPKRMSLSSPPKHFKSHLPEPVHSRSAIPHPNLRTDSERSVAAGVLGATKPPPLNLSMRKRRDVVDVERSSSPLDSKPSPIDPKRKKHMRKESGAEQLDRHVSRVLSTLPSRITFKPSLSGPSIESLSASSTPSNTLRPRPALSSKPSRAGLTLSAVQPDPASKKPSAADSDVKLYHLTQEGKDQPIKLFVRLVGEGERVMVRVGGGWADLGEYLRQYAEHHGHRTFSDGKLEVSAAAAKGGSMRVGGGMKSRTPLSRPGSVMDRPGSSMSVRTSRSSFGAGALPFDLSSSPSSSSQADTSTPVNTSRGYQTPTGSIKSSSRPSTSDTFSHASPSSWSGVDIGLAGPAAKRGGGLDEQKARWVEEMIGRAKMASAEKKKDERAWADMGKVGGTRRMHLKHKQQGDNGSGSS